MTQKVKTAIANFAYSPIVSWILSKTGGGNFMDKNTGEITPEENAFRSI